MDQSPNEEIEGNYYWGLRDLIREASTPIVDGVLRQWVEPGSDVLELGCGTGELYAMLPADYRANYTGLDINQEFLGINQERHPDATLASGDAYKLPFENASRSAVIAMNLLDILPDYKIITVFSNSNIPFNLPLAA